MRRHGPVHLSLDRPSFGDILPLKPRIPSYRVGSENFLPRKIGHAHDNSADSEDVAGARESNVHAYFTFRFENGQGN